MPKCPTINGFTKRMGLFFVGHGAEMKWCPTVMWFWNFLKGIVVGHFGKEARDINKEVNII